MHLLLLFCCCDFCSVSSFYFSLVSYYQFFSMIDWMIAWFVSCCTYCIIVCVENWCYFFAWQREREREKEGILYPIPYYPFPTTNIPYTYLNSSFFFVCFFFFNSSSVGRQEIMMVMMMMMVIFLVVVWWWWCSRTSTVLAVVNDSFWLCRIHWTISISFFSLLSYDQDVFFCLPFQFHHIWSFYYFHYHIYITNNPRASCVVVDTITNVSS